MKRTWMAVLAVAVVLLAGTAQAGQSYYASFDCTGKSGKTYQMLHPSIEACYAYLQGRYMNRATGLCWRKVGSKAWNQLHPNDKDICLGSPVNGGCACNVHWESETRQVPPAPARWRVFGRQPVGSTDRQWTKLSDGPFASRYDCETAVVEAAKRNGITDRSVFDDFVCWEEQPTH